MKKYKVREPEETIHIIREIIYTLGLILKEDYIQNGNFYSCRVSIGNGNLKNIDIGANGKGRSFEYSLASGYAEFMERLQNGILLNFGRILPKQNVIDHNDNTYRFENNEIFCESIFDSDEKLVAIEDLVSLIGTELQRLLKLNSNIEVIRFFNKLDFKNTLSIPFYSVFEDKLVYLPIDVIHTICGSNGMCAGNSPKEAIIQGIGEIFERYAMAEIYYNQLTPPTIPLTEFTDTPIYSRVESLLQDGLNIIIKDCSLNKGLPVIGVIIIDQESNTYNFSLASDVIPYIALERCLNEVHQGTNGFKKVTNKLLDLNDIKEIEIVEPVYNSFKKKFVDGYGDWPYSIFSSNDSYKFNGLNHIGGQSDVDDLRALLALVKESGFNIFIRDNSILGFPTFHIVIPGMSQLINRNENLLSYHRTYHDIDLIRTLGSINEEKALKLLIGLEKNLKLLKFHNSSFTQRFRFNLNQDISEIDIELLLFMLNYYLQNYDKVVWPPINRTIVTEGYTNINFSTDICIGKEQPRAIIRPMVVEM